MKIAVCAGHHAKSKGATNKKYNLNEFDETTKIANHLIKLLLKDGHQVQFISGGLTHKVATINEGGFDLALDLHLNADYDHLDPDDLDDTRGTGAMVMHYPKAKLYSDKEPVSVRQEQAGDFSFLMSTYLGERNHGARPGWYWGSNPPTQKDYFLSKTNCAAFIPEAGYIDNNHFAEKWLVSGKHEQVAQAIHVGIEKIVTQV